MLFTGEHEHTIDSKHRLAVPSVIRSRLESRDHTNVFYLVKGANGALWLWPEKTFEERAGAMKQSLLPTKEMMEFGELLFSQTTRLELDKAGRIRLPERILKEAGIAGSVMILGINDHLELRDPAEWRIRLQQKLSKHEEIMDNARRVMEEQQRST